MAFHACRAVQQLACLPLVACLCLCLSIVFKQCHNHCHAFYTCVQQAQQVLRHLFACLRLRLCAPDSPADEQLVDLWLTTVGVLAKNLCKDECQPLRDNSIMVLR